MTLPQTLWIVAAEVFFLFLMVCGLEEFQKTRDPWDIRAVSAIGILAFFGLLLFLV